MTRVQRDRSYSQRSGSMFARVCLRGGSGITYTLYGCIIPPWLRQFTQGGTCTSLFTDVMCSSRSLCPSFFKGRRPISGSRNPLWEENHHRVARLSSYSSICVRLIIRRIDWTKLWFLVDTVNEHFLEVQNSNIFEFLIKFRKISLMFLFSCTFQKARCRVSKQDWFIRTISVQSTFTCNYFGEGRASVNKLRNPARISNLEFISLRRVI